MAIDFLQVSPEEAVIKLQEQARKGYASKLAMQAEYNEAGHENINNTMVADWTNKVHTWIEETRQVLLEIYSSPNYMYRFLEAPPNVISTSEDKRFTNIKHALLSRIKTLEGYTEFIIQHSNPVLSITKNDVAVLNLNPNRDLNIAGRDVKTKNK